jgi:integrase
MNSVCSITVNDAIEQWLNYLKLKGRATKTLCDYKSKCKYLSNELGPKKVNELTPMTIENFLVQASSVHRWSNKTFNNARAIYSTLFTWNLLAKTRKRIVNRSHRHEAYSEEHFNLLYKSIQADKVTALFCKFIYYCLLRPAEIRKLQVKHFNLVERTIFLPGSITKNRRDAIVPVPDQLLSDLHELGIASLEKELYVFGEKKELFKHRPLGNNTIGRVIRIHLKKLGLDNNNYTLYAIKHYSNIQMIKSGWQLADLYKKNRHASVEETANYLRALSRTTDISTKPQPSIL